MNINSKTKLYCVLGNPVSHSMSPAVHNLALGLKNIDGVYTAFCVDDIGAALAGIRGLGIAGASVTIPHKESVMAHLDGLDETASAIGAVNTIVSRDGGLYGYNTDCTGAVVALEERIDLGSRRVVILGAGGAARAIGFGVGNAGGKPVICARNAQKGEALARELSADFVALEDFTGAGCDILVNTTPVGMWPDDGKSPVDGSLINENMVVMDIVYNPIETKLLKDARERGAVCIDGVSMFVQQAAEQFRLWTGEDAPVEAMERKVREILRKK